MRKGLGNLLYTNKIQNIPLRFGFKSMRLVLMKHAKFIYVKIRIWTLHYVCMHMLHMNIIPTLLLHIDMIYSFIQELKSRKAHWVIEHILEMMMISDDDDKRVKSLSCFTCIRCGFDVLFCFSFLPLAPVRLIW